MARPEGGPPRWLWSLVLLITLLSLGRAHAQADDSLEGAPRSVLEPVREPKLPEPAFSIEPSVWSGMAAFVPGFVLPGSGAFVAGDRKAAKHIALARASGFAALFGTGAVIAATGTSRRLIGPLAPIAIMGTGTFLVGWLADIYAATTGGRNHAHALNWVPVVEAELGYRYVYDPQFAYRNFSYLRADFRGGRFRASPSAWVGLDENNQRVALDIAGRVLGRTPRRGLSDASYVDVASAFTYHNYARERFNVWTTEWRLDGRLDLLRLGKSLSGSFVEGHVGAGLEFYDYDGGFARAREAFGLLLARFGFGVYFGDGVARTGELLVYYDHRHDDYAAGMGVRGVGGGILGHIGATGHYFVTESWGLALMGELGSAYIAGLSVRYRLRPRGEGG